MKRKPIICVCIMAVMMSTRVMAQEPNDTFIKIEDDNIFSQCFQKCDTNGDGVVTYAEAAQTEILGLDRGGRSNIITDYDFLKYFPNLTAFSVGNTPETIIDLHHLTRLQLLNVSNAPWLETVILYDGLAPEITGKDDVKVVFFANQPEVGFKEGGNDNSAIAFKDNSIKEFCLRNKVDANQDGEISVEEAKALKKLSLMNFKSFIRYIKSYDDLKYFPNLEYFHAGMTYAETLDVSGCPMLKELDATDCRMLKVIVLAKGCKPEIKYPVAYKGEKAKVVYQ